MAREKKEKSPKKLEKVERMRKMEFKPDMRSATAIVSAIAFLQKTGFHATLRNIKTCVTQRCRKPATTILNNLTFYLTRGTELGILKKHNGVYKLGNFELKKRRKRTVKPSISKKKPFDEQVVEHENVEDVPGTPTEDCTRNSLFAF